MGIRIGPPPPLDPRTIPGLRGWYRENVSTSGANVTSWNDMSGVGNHLAVGGGTSPTLISADASIRSKQAIDFTSTQSLQSSVQSTSWFSTTFTVFFIHKWSGTGTCGAVVTSGRSIAAHNGNWILMERTCSPDTELSFNTSTFSPGYITQNGVWTVQSLRWNGSTCEHRMYGFSSSGAMTAYTTSTNPVTIGGNSWSGRCAELIVSNQYLDDVWMGLVFAYLKNRYGL